MKTWRLTACAAVLIQTFAAVGAAQAQDPAPSSGVSLNLLYTGELWRNAQGGLRRGNAYMQNVDAQLRVDAGTALGWQGGSFLFEGFYETKSSLGSHYVGSVDQQSPIDAAWKSDIFRVYQFYYEQDFGSTDVLFGIYDLETEFSSTKPMSLFLSKNLTWNTALDQSGTMPQNGSIGPGNYPYTPLAVRVRQQLAPGYSVQVVLANAASDNPRRQTSNDVVISPKYGALGMVEFDYTPKSTTKVMVGLWGLTSRLPVNGQFQANGAPRTVAGQQGGYIGGATRLYTQAGKRGLDGFLTLGLSSEQSTNTSQSINGGFVYTGLFDARPNDKAGISFNINTAPASYRRAQIALGNGFHNNEASFEVTYRAKITDWLTVQPDVQYITNPGYAPKAKDDLVFGLHVEIGHLFDL